MKIGELEKNAGQAADLLSALSNSRRLLVLCKLVNREMSVNALAESIGLSQSAISQHLAKLRDKKLVATRRDGQTIYYRIASENARAILVSLHGIFCAR
jgi:DNA-binding transcriptional ArsR family regulator